MQSDSETHENFHFFPLTVAPRGSRGPWRRGDRGRPEPPQFGANSATAPAPSRGHLIPIPIPIPVPIPGPVPGRGGVEDPRPVPVPVPVPPLAGGEAELGELAGPGSFLVTAAGGG